MEGFPDVVWGDVVRIVRVKVLKKRVNTLVSENGAGLDCSGEELGVIDLPVTSVVYIPHYLFNLVLR